MATHVLLVEDEKDLATVVAYGFRQAGFDVVTAASGSHTSTIVETTLWLVICAQYSTLE